MPFREYATIHGETHHFLQFVTLVEHTKDTLDFMEGWEVLNACYGFHDDKPRDKENVSFCELYDGALNVTDAYYDMFDPDVCNDVTEIVKDMWAAKRSIRPKNKFFGDPCYSQRKMLFITLRQVQWDYYELQGSGWRRTWSYQYNRYYYYHANTRETSWTLPDFDNEEEEGILEISDEGCEPTPKQAKGH